MKNKIIIRTEELSKSCQNSSFNESKMIRKTLKCPKNHVKLNVNTISYDPH